MKFCYSILFIMSTHFALAQNVNRNEFIIGYHFGRNANAYTADAVAKPFLDEGLGQNRGLYFDYIIYTKKNRIFQLSYSHSFLNHSISPSNLRYEFGYDYDDDCCLRIGSGQLMAGGIKYLFKFYDGKKTKILGGIGISLNLDISDSSGGITYEGRKNWSEANAKTGPVIFPSYDVSTKLTYNLTKDYFITANVSFVHAPFTDLDFEYTILSRDGMFKGSFYQKISSVILSIGIGMKI